MKWGLKPFTLLSAIAVALLSSCASLADSSLSSKMEELSYEMDTSRLLHVEGEDIYNAKGEKVMLRGTNAGGLFVQEEWMNLTRSRDLLNTITVLTSLYGQDAAFELLDIYENTYWNYEDFENCQDLNLNVLRLPISYADVYKTDFSIIYSEEVTTQQINGLKLTYREDHLRKIDAFIRDAEKHGLYVILDLHGAWGSQNGNDHSIDSRQHDWLWRDDELGEAFREKTRKTWIDLAKRYKNFTNIAGYDLLNEPAGDNSAGTDITTTTGKIQWDFFDELYNDIRAIDPNHIIIMESCWNANNLPNPSTYGWENIVYQYHHYEWSGLDNDATQLSSHTNKVKNIKSANYGVPIYMGEFRVFGETLNPTKQVLNLYNQNDIHWTSWCYKVKGNSNWGLYCIPTSGENAAETARIVSIDDCDGFEEIKRKWSSQRKGQTKNEEFADAVAKAAKGESL